MKATTKSIWQNTTTFPRNNMVCVLDGTKLGLISPWQDNLTISPWTGRLTTRIIPRPAMSDNPPSYELSDADRCVGEQVFADSLGWGANGDALYIAQLERAREIGQELCKCLEDLRRTTQDAYDHVLALIEEIDP